MLYSALDAHIRHLGVVVPLDAVAHIDVGLAEAALRMLERTMSAELRPSGESTFDGAPFRLTAAGRAQAGPGHRLVRQGRERLRRF